MITREIAATLKHGQILHHKIERQGRNGCEPLRVRVSGQVKTWVKRPDDFRIPVKHGMYTNSEITQNNASEWEVAA